MIFIIQGFRTIIFISIVIFTTSRQKGEIEKSGIADHISKGKGNHLPLWDEVKIIDREELWRIRRLKESTPMSGYSVDQV